VVQRIGSVDVDEVIHPDGATFTELRLVISDRPKTAEQDVYVLIVAS